MTDPNKPPAARYNSTFHERQVLDHIVAGGSDARRGLRSAQQVRPGRLAHRHADAPRRRCRADEAMVPARTKIMSKNEELKRTDGIEEA